MTRWVLKVEKSVGFLRRVFLPMVESFLLLGIRRDGIIPRSSVLRLFWPWYSVLPGCVSGGLITVHVKQLGMFP